MIQEFKDFIARGNVMDMAVGIIIGGAFTAIVTSLVDKIITPLIAIVTGGGEIGAGWQIAVGSAVIDFGAFVGAIINFLIIALVVFLLVKGVNNLDKKAKEARGISTEEEEPASCPFCKEEVNAEATRCPHCAGEIDLAAAAESAAE